MLSLGDDFKVLRRTVSHWKNFVERSWRLRPNFDLERVR